MVMAYLVLRPVRGVPEEDERDLPQPLRGGRGDADRLCGPDGADRRSGHRHGSCSTDLRCGPGSLFLHLRPCKSQPETAGLNRRPDAGADLFRRRNGQPGLRQPDGRRCQGTMVRADAECDV